MKYTFSGQFCGSIAPEFSEPLAGVTVRLYKYRGTKYVTSLAVTDPQETMTILSAEAASAKASSLLAETTTDAEGNFVFTLDEQAGYKGDAFDLDLWLTTVPGRKTLTPHSPLQITLTTMKPRWQPTDSGYSAHWDYCLPADFWRNIYAHFDAWVACGRVTVRGTQQPVSGVRVTAVDADWLQDDELGSALTDAEGRFRIDYARADFTRTPLSPLINAEDGGPDLYFSVETATGTPLLNEPKAQGHTAGRENAACCCFVELSVDTQIELVPERGGAQS
jgi:hypothetical protein